MYKTGQTHDIYCHQILVVLHDTRFPTEHFGHFEAQFPNGAKILVESVSNLYSFTAG